MEPNETLPKSNRLAAAIAAVLITCSLIGFGWLLYTRAEMASQAEMPANISQTDMLYYRMGVVKIPSVYPPSDLVLRDLNGKRVRLSEIRGNVVFLNFWATWCAACRIEMPAMEELYRRLKDNGFAMVAVSMQESAESVKQYFSSSKLSFTALLDTDGAVASEFGVFSIPTTYILSREGAVIGKSVGSREWNSRESIALFEHLMGVEQDLPSS
jgi:peroxiredoxin